MKHVLFDIGHPAHVHLFKNPIKLLKNEGWNVFVLARKKDVTFQLLDAYRIAYVPGTIKSIGAFSSLAELIKWFAIARKIINKHSVRVVASIGSPASAWAAASCGIPHLAFNDTEISWEQRMLYRPATAKIFTPRFLFKDFGPKQVRYNGTHDLAYLRPEWFQPDKTILNELGLRPGESFALLRFVSWQATHDWGKKKSNVDSQKTMLGRILKNHRVFISAEGTLPADLEEYRLKIPPHRLHDVIAYASLVAGDGSTTLTEAAVLGVPALYISSLAKQLGVLQFFIKRGLLSIAETSDEGLKLLDELLINPEIEERLLRKNKMITETIDVSAYIAERIVAHVI